MAQLVEESNPVMLRITGIAGGAAVSLLILIGIARAQKTSLPETPPPIEELRALAVEMPPPPPPRASAMETPLPPTAVELEPEPEPGGIRISARVRPQHLPIPTVATPSLELDLEALKPRGGLQERSPHHVYQLQDVDQRPVVLYREMPHVPEMLHRSVDDPRVTLLFVVNVDGAVENIHVLRTPSEEFGEIMVKAVQEWRFRPAMKGGRKVRCMIQLPIFVKPASTSRFHH